MISTNTNKKETSIKSIKINLNQLKSKNVEFKLSCYNLTL